MRGYEEIVTQADMDALMDRVSDFHDSLTKELHIATRGHVEPDRGIVMPHRLDVRMLLQTPLAIRAVELLFVGVESMSLMSSDLHSSALGHVTTRSIPSEYRRVSIRFGPTLEISAERLFVRERAEWSGPVARFGEEVPHPETVPASMMFDAWRQCGACADGFEWPVGETYALCPSCGAMTELEGDAR